MASRGLNKVQLIGNLGKDVEMKYTSSGKAVASASLAVGDGKGETEWFRLVAWEKTAEMLNEYGTKGKKLYVEGRLQTRKFENKQGQEVTIVEVVVSSFLLLDSRGDGESRQAATAVAASDNDDDELPF